MVRPRRVVGIDQSEAFLALAGGETLRLDVTRDPLPEADLAYCRFLLSHVEDPVDVVGGWLGSVRRVLVEEVERIDTRDPAFAAYLGAVRGLLAERGHRLEVGPALGAAYGGEVVTVEPDPARVAQMFAANARALDLEAPGLAAARGRIVWGLRQTAIDGRAA